MTPALVAHSLALLHGLRCQKKGKRNRMKIAAKGVRFLASAKPTAAPLDPEAGRHMHLNPRMSVMPPEDKVAMRSFVGCVVSHPTSPEPPSSCRGYCIALTIRARYCGHRFPRVEIVTAMFLLGRILVPCVILDPHGHLDGKRIKGGGIGPRTKQNLRVLATIMWRMLFSIYQADPEAVPGCNPKVRAVCWRAVPGVTKKARV